MNNKETESERVGGKRKRRLIRGSSCVHASLQLKHFFPLSLNPIFLSAPHSPSISLSACISARALSKKSLSHLFFAVGTQYGYANMRK